MIEKKFVCQFYESRGCDERHYKDPNDNEFELELSKHLKYIPKEDMRDES